MRIRAGTLGRRTPTTGKHVERHPYSTVTSGTPQTVEEVLKLPGWHRRHDQASEGSCFKAGTLITMADGSTKPIEEIKTLDSVISAEGRPQRVLQTMVRDAFEPIYSIQMGGHSHLELTGEHPILTERGYVSANEIKAGDGIAIPRIKNRLKASVLEAHNFVDLKSLRRRRIGSVQTGGVDVLVTALPETIQLTGEFGRLIGLYLAEGSCDDTKIKGTFNSNEKDLIEETASLIQIALGARARIQPRPNNSTNVVLYGKHGSLLFKEICGTGSSYKGLNGSLSKADDGFLSEVLGGGLDGDGHYRRNRGQGVTISHKLALDMFNLANMLGLRPSIRKSDPYLNNGAKTRQPRGDIEIPDADSDTYRCKKDDNYIGRSVKGITSELFSGSVYNIHVEHDNSYIAEGIGVHNCVGHGVAMERAIMNTRQNILANLPIPRARRYNPIRIWNQAKLIDEGPDTNPGDGNGTSVSAGYDVVRNEGVQRVKSISVLRGQVIPNVGKYKPVKADGISANRWAVSVDEIRAAIVNKTPVTIGVNGYSSFDNPFEFDNEWGIDLTGRAGIRGGHCLVIYGASDSRQAVKLKNSGGKSYPEVGLPYRVMDQLLYEYGEAAIVTDI